MRTLVAALVLGTACAMAGCSADPEPESSYVRPTVSEPVAFDASASTKEDLGVVVWGADGAEGAMRVTGYDRAGRAVLHVEQRTVVVDAAHHYFETTLAGDDGESARMRMDGTVGAIDANHEFDIELKMTEDTFASSPHAQSVIDHLRSDMEGGTANAPSLLEAHALAPRDGQQLVQQSCSELLKGCGKSIVKFGAPLLPCVGLAWNALVVMRCALVGGLAAGPAGALAGGAVCGIQRADSIVKNAGVCAARAQNIYENFGSRTDDMVKDCGGAKSGCSGGGGVPMASFSAQ